MSEQARWEYYITMPLRYLKADKAERQRKLDEFCKVCKYHRKYAIKKLNQTPNLNLNVSVFSMNLLFSFSLNYA